MRPIHRTPRPQRRSSRGALVFLLFVALLVLVGATLVEPLAADAVVALATDHDTLLKQPAVRALVATRVGPGADLAADANGRPRAFVLSSGETAGAVARRLVDERLVRSALAFELVLYESGEEDSMQAGTYSVSPSMSPREIAKLFERAPGAQTTLRIIEGWRLSEVAVAVHKSFPDVGEDAFTAAAVVGARADPMFAGLDPKTPLEGFLYPDTYFFAPTASAPQIVDALLATFERRVGPDLRAAAADRKATVYDIVKLASIVEREARDRNESPIIAGVYANRLRIGMKLDADPTIQYALGDWRELSLDDLKKDSPYNTYRVAGLPPTPICNPGAAALLGAARPAAVPYFYFVAKNDGSGDHAFAVTVEEQEANRVKFGNK